MFPRTVSTVVPAVTANQQRPTDAVGKSGSSSSILAQQQHVLCLRTLMHPLTLAAVCATEDVAFIHSICDLCTAMQQQRSHALANRPKLRITEVAPARYRMPSATSRITIPSATPCKRTCLHPPPAGCCACSALTSQGTLQQPLLQQTPQVQPWQQQPVQPSASSCPGRASPC